MKGHQYRTLIVVWYYRSARSMETL